MRHQQAAFDQDQGSGRGQPSELCFRGRGRRDENPDAGGMSPHLDKKRKDGPATYAYDAMGKRTEIYDPVLGGTYEYFNGATRDSYKGGTHWTIDGGVFTYEVGSYDYGCTLAARTTSAPPK